MSATRDQHGLFSSHAIDVITMHAALGEAYAAHEREALIDRAVREVFAEMFQSAWERRFYRRYSADVHLVPEPWMSSIRAEFARLAAER